MEEGEEEAGERAGRPGRGLRETQGHSLYEIQGTEERRKSRETNFPRAAGGRECTWIS